jgi:antitoxin MazE
MRTRIRKWGNSLALRIPKSFAAEVGLCENVVVDLSVTEGKLVVQPHGEEPPSLGDLLRGVTAENLLRARTAARTGSSSLFLELPPFCLASSYANREEKPVVPPASARLSAPGCNSR